MPKPIAIQINDIHLKKENIDTVKDISNQLISTCKELNVSNVIIAGDVFDSRTSQRLEVLNAFLYILDNFQIHNIHCYVIAGNHDKTRYDSEDSFLDAFCYHPAMTLFRNYNVKEIGGVNFHFMPFFEEKMYLDIYNTNNTKEGKKEAKNALITHIAITGSRNNDGTLVESSLNVELFQDFNKVFSGHYHDYQVIKDKFIHCPSPYQANYGEDEKKGFTVIYDDLSYEIKVAEFKRFKKVKINIDDTNKKELDELLKQYSKSEDNIRFEIVGSESKVKALQKDRFVAAGIDVKTKVKEINDSLIYAESEEIVSYDTSSIKEAFKEFCEDNELNYEEGLKYLNYKLNG